MRALFLVGLAACGRVGFDAPPGIDGRGSDGAADASAVQPIHHYPLHDSYDDVFGGPPLTPNGGGFIGNRYQFGPGQGLSVEGAMPHQVYTIDMTFSFQSLTSWNKVVDFGDLVPDTGLYTYEAAVQYVIVQSADFLTSEAQVEIGTSRRLTTTRDASGTVTAYIDGVIAVGARGATPDPPTGALSPMTFVDSTNIAALSTDRVHFFIDDSATNDETAAGTVEELRIYDVALTAQQVAEIR